MAQKKQPRLARLKVPSTDLKRTRVMVALARSVVTKMTGNPDFVTPVPTLADVTTAADALEVANLQAGFRFNRGGKAATDIKLARANELYQLLLRLGAYVMHIARTTAATIQDQSVIITGSGFPTFNPQKGKKLLQNSSFNRRVNNRNIPATSRIIQWKKPKGLIKGQAVSGYKIFSEGVQVGTTTKGYWEVPSTIAQLSVARFTITPFNKKGSGAPFQVYLRGMSVPPTV